MNQVSSQGMPVELIEVKIAQFVAGRFVVARTISRPRGALRNILEHAHVHSQFSDDRCTVESTPGISSNKVSCVSYGFSFSWLRWSRTARSSSAASSRLSCNRNKKRWCSSSFSSNAGAPVQESSRAYVPWPIQPFPVGSLFLRSLLAASVDRRAQKRRRPRWLT